MNSDVPPFNDGDLVEIISAVTELPYPNGGYALVIESKIGTPSIPKYKNETLEKKWVLSLLWHGEIEKWVDPEWVKLIT
tara:strand:+ start:174 stop:410 length:237 start_codon:yes stop_codon:yes gene_type:complete